MRKFQIVLGTVILLVGMGRPSLAFDPDLGSCPLDAVYGSQDIPTARVAVYVQKVRPNTDLEGDDIPFIFDNRADIYGRVTINGVVHSLPHISPVPGDTRARRERRLGTRGLLIVGRSPARFCSEASLSDQALGDERR